MGLHFQVELRGRVLRATSRKFYHRWMCFVKLDLLAILIKSSTNVPRISTNYAVFCAFSRGFTNLKLTNQEHLLNSLL